MANGLSIGTNTGMQKSSGSLTTTTNPQKTTSVQKTVNPFDVSGSSSSGGIDLVGATQDPTYTDPYAKYGGTAAYNDLVSGFGSQKDSIYSSSRAAAKNTGLGLQNTILDLIDSVMTGQTSIDNRGVNNELSKQRGVADTYSAVGRGIQSGAVTLANKNASDSSASDAIARAYGNIGQRQLSDIGNQYELENQDIGLAQADLDRQATSGLRRIETSREQAVNSIVDEANNKLAALDAAMMDASLPDRLAINDEKSRIRSEVLGVLSDYDNKLGDVSKIDPTSQDARIAEATRRGQLGQAPANSFSYDTTMPAQFQGTGPFASDLPIFSYRKAKV